MILFSAKKWYWLDNPDIIELTLKAHLLSKADEPFFI